MFHYEEHEITLVDLPGIYSLSTYSMEEVVSRDFIMREHHAVLVPDIEPLRIGEPQEYETMNGFGVHSYIEAPVYEGDELKGFLAVDNPAPQKFEHLEEVMNGHIGKPVNSQELYQKICQALHKD